MVLLGTTVSFTLDPMPETTLVATRLTGLTSQPIAKQVLNGKPEVGPTCSSRLADLRISIRGNVIVNVAMLPAC